MCYCATPLFILTRLVIKLSSNYFQLKGVIYLSLDQRYHVEMTAKLYLGCIYDALSLIRFRCVDKVVSCWVNNHAPPQTYVIARTSSHHVNWRIMRMDLNVDPWTNTWLDGDTLWHSRDSLLHKRLDLYVWKAARPVLSLVHDDDFKMADRLYRASASITRSSAQTRFMRQIKAELLCSMAL